MTGVSEDGRLGDPDGSGLGGGCITHRSAVRAAVMTAVSISPGSPPSRHRSSRTLTGSEYTLPRHPRRQRPSRGGQCAHRYACHGAGGDGGGGTLIEDVAEHLGEEEGPVVARQQHSKVLLPRSRNPSQYPSQYRVSIRVNIQCTIRVNIRVIRTGAMSESAFELASESASESITVSEPSSEQSQCPVISESVRDSFLIQYPSHVRVSQATSESLKSCPSL